VIARWNEAGEIGGLLAAVPTINEAVTKFFEDAAARCLRAATTTKYRISLEWRPARALVAPFRARLSRCWLSPIYFSMVPPA
jgi:hypothetical protein